MNNDTPYGYTNSCWVLTTIGSLFKKRRSTKLNLNLTGFWKAERATQTAKS